MSKLDDLIKEYCPDGVEYTALLAVTDVLYGYPCDSSLFNENGDGKPLVRIRDVLRGNTSTFTTEIIPDKYLLSSGDLLIGMDGNFHVGNWKVDGAVLCQRVCKVFSKNDTILMNRFLSHLMRPIVFEIENNKQSGTVKHLLDKDLKSIIIPVPPLPVQAEIVRILDSFTETEQELENQLALELEKRKMQYEYYRKQLLSFSDKVIWKTLGEIGKVSMCKRILKNETSSIGDIPFYKIGTFGKQADSYISKDTFEKYKTQYSYPKKGDILISAAGTIGRTVIFDGEPAYFQDSNIVWLANDESQVLNQFLFYWYQTSPWKVSTGGTISRLYNDNIAGAKVPVLPLNIQETIIQKLSKLETICFDLYSGLPAEIEARHKQYEYYRDKLLSFKPLET